MEEKTMQEWLDEHESDEMTVENGDLMEGTIHSLGRETAVVLLGHRFDGICEIKELEEEERVIGNRMQFVVKRVDDEQGQILLSRRDARQAEALILVEEAFREERTVEVRTLEIVKGGLRVDFQGMRGFMPFSQIDTAYVEEPERWLGQVLEVRILRWEPDENNLVVSRRLLRETIQKQEEASFYESLEPDQILTGRVHKLFRAGALIDLGPAFGYLHIHDAAWHRVGEMEEVIRPGDEIQVKVKSFDPVERRIALSLKDISEDPWTRVHRDFGIGDVVYGTVFKDVGSGLLAELETGIVGYIHKSQLAGVKWKLDEEMAFTIESIDAANHRIALRYFDEEAVADDYEADSEEEGATLGDLFGDVLDKIR